MSITVDSWIALTNFVTRPSYIGFGFNQKDTVILSNDLSPENGSAEVSRVFPIKEDMSNDLQPIPVASLKLRVSSWCIPLFTGKGIHSMQNSST